MGMFNYGSFTPAQAAETPDYALAAAREGQYEAEAKAQANALRSSNLMGGGLLGVEGYKMTHPATTTPTTTSPLTPMTTPAPGATPTLQTAPLRGNPVASTPSFTDGPIDGQMPGLDAYAELGGADPTLTASIDPTAPAEGLAQSFAETGAQDIGTDLLVDAGADLATEAAVDAGTTALTDAALTAGTDAALTAGTGALTGAATGAAAGTAGATAGSSALLGMGPLGWAALAASFLL